MNKTTKKRPAAPKSVSVGALAATLLGHWRATGAALFSQQQLTLAFPRFNEMEMAYALDELLEKGLLLMKGGANEVYALTDLGREGRIGVA